MAPSKDQQSEKMMVLYLEMQREAVLAPWMDRHSGYSMALSKDQQSEKMMALCLEMTREAV
jgi:hypothetical protein